MTTLADILGDNEADALAVPLVAWWLSRLCPDLLPEARAQAKEVAEVLAPLLPLLRRSVGELTSWYEEGRHAARVFGTFTGEEPPEQLVADYIEETLEGVMKPVAEILAHQYSRAPSGWTADRIRLATGHAFLRTLYLVAIRQRPYRAQSYVCEEPIGWPELKSLAEFTYVRGEGEPREDGDTILDWLPPDVWPVGEFRAIWPDEARALWKVWLWAVSAQHPQLASPILAVWRALEPCASGSDIGSCDSPLCTVFCRVPCAADADLDAPPWGLDISLVRDDVVTFVCPRLSGDGTVSAKWWIVPRNWKIGVRIEVERPGASGISEYLPGPPHLDWPQVVEFATWLAGQEPEVQKRVLSPAVWQFYIALMTLSRLDPGQCWAWLEERLVPDDEWTEEALIALVRAMGPLLVWTEYRVTIEPSGPG